MNELNKPVLNAPNRFKPYIVIGAFIFLAVAAFATAVVSFEISYANRFYPGVRIGSLTLGGLTKADATTQLALLDQQLQTTGVIFQTDNKSITVTSVLASETNPDLAQEIFALDWKVAVEQAYAVGRTGGWWKRLGQQLFAAQRGSIPIGYRLNSEGLLGILHANFGDLEQPARNAALVIHGTTYDIVPEQSGMAFQYDQAISEFKQTLSQASFKPIKLVLTVDQPTVRKDQIGSALNSLDSILALQALTLKADEKEFIIRSAEFIPWLEFQRVDQAVVIGLNHEAVVERLQKIADTVNVPARDAKFNLADGRVKEFQASQDGRGLDIEAGYNLLNEAIRSGRTAPIILTFVVTPATVNNENVNTLGINELIGRGETNFAGSPVNRRFNIGVGAAALNGVLIAPGEEFSLLKTLGSIDAASGYKRELVIKGDRTLPEFGGGLCQIGTTTFRAVLSTGLPVTQRRNHSYRVSYYEPPVGMDATIYEPAPDFRFINDTGHHILFTTKIDGDNLIFEFYGTRDGRVATTTQPRIFNRVSPGEPRYIDTNTLPPGEKKQVEKAHAGADAEFTYTVTYPNNEVKTEVFRSHYVPWKETWLVGLTPSTTDAITVPGGETTVVPPVVPAPVVP